MTNLHFLPIPTDTVRALQSGGTDANGQTPERDTSDGQGNPCRHCLDEIAEGDEYLILAHRPFPEPQPYAEQGPVFLHAEPCEAYAKTDVVPGMFLEWNQLMIRGYGPDDRIVYGTGKVVDTSAMAQAADHMLERDEISYIHVRSASNNCFQCRIERGSP